MRPRRRPPRPARASHRLVFSVCPGPRGTLSGATDGPRTGDGQAEPSLENGSAVQVDEIGESRSGTSPKGEVEMPVGVSRRKTGEPAPPSKCPANAFSTPPTFSCHEMYGSLPEKVMSG